MAKGIEISQRTATSRTETTSVAPGERHVQHEVKLLGVVPVFRRTIEPLNDGTYVTAHTYFGALRSGVTRRALYGGTDASTVVNNLRLENVTVKMPRPQRQTYSVL